MNAAIGKMLISEVFLAALKRPTARLTPVMISQSGLVRFPAAGKAAVGLRTASMNAHASTTKAATRRIQFTQLSGVSALKVNTMTIYRLPAPGGSVHGSAPAAATLAARGACPDSSNASATGSVPGGATGAGPSSATRPLAPGRAAAP